MKTFALFISAILMLLCHSIPAFAEITGELHLSSSRLTKQAAPGEVIGFSFNVRNHADSDRDVYLDFSDFHGWAISAPDQVFAPANDKVVVDFTVRMPTNGSAGNDFITVTATADTDVASLKFLARRTWYEPTESPADTLMATAVYDSQQNLFWIVGGNDNEDLIHGVSSYDPETGVWNDEYADPDILVTNGGACMIDGRIFMVGGIQEDFSYINLTNALQIYNTGTGRWRFGEPIDEEKGIMSPGIACDPDRGRVWVVGGMNGNLRPLMKVRYYDILNDEWVSEGIALFPNPFWSVRAIYHNGALRTVSLYNLNSYDIETNTWSDLGILPYERVETAYGLHGKHEYMVGGWRFGQYGEIVSDYSAIYRSVETEEDWQFDELIMPAALGPTTGAFGDQGKFYMFGGLSTGAGEGEFLTRVFEYPLAEGIPDDNYAGESPETMLAYDDGDSEYEFSIACTPCSIVQGFEPKLYPVRLKSFSWWTKEGSNLYDYTPHRIVVYYDAVADGIPQSNTPFYRSELIEDGEDDTWNTFDLSDAPILQTPVDSGEIFIGLEYINTSPLSVRPLLGFDMDSAPVNRTWYKVQGTWESTMISGKVGVMMMRAGIEFLGEMPDEIDDDADDDLNDDASDDDDLNDDDNEGPGETINFGTEESHTGDDDDSGSCCGC